MKWQLNLLQRWTPKSKKTETKKEEVKDEDKNQEATKDVAEVAEEETTRTGKTFWLICKFIDSFIAACKLCRKSTVY